MPSGRVHRAITTVLQVGNIPIFLYVDPAFGLGVHTGLFLGRWINPDLDTYTGRLGPFEPLFEAYRRQTAHRAGLSGKYWRHFGLKDVWKLIFYSHVPFTSTFLRFVIILYIPTAILLLFSLLNFGIIWYIIGIYAGLSENDCAHTLADVVVTFIKILLGQLGEVLRGKMGRKRAEARTNKAQDHLHARYGQSHAARDGGRFRYRGKHRIRLFKGPY